MTNKNKATTKTQANEGEGSRSAARAYNRGLAEHERTADVDALAEAAAAALDSAEGTELREAETAGKLGRPVRAASGKSAPRSGGAAR